MKLLNSIKVTIERPLKKDVMTPIKSEETIVYQYDLEEERNDHIKNMEKNGFEFVGIAEDYNLELTAVFRKTWNREEK